MTLERKTEYVRGDVRFYVFDGPRVVQFVTSLGWGLRRHECLGLAYPRGSDLGYHSPEPMYKGSTPMDGECEWTGGPCYYDGTSLGAEEPMRILQDEGEEALFRFLEAHWHRIFEDRVVGGFGALVQQVLGGAKP